VRRLLPVLKSEAFGRLGYRRACRRAGHQPA
jgi:hypothetical protein